MDIEDGCISVEIPEFRKRKSASIFSRAYIEYAILISTHFCSYLVYRRYSQFRQLRNSVRSIQIPANYHRLLPPFPRRILKKNRFSTSKTRRAMLEIWLISVLRESVLISRVLDFLEVPAEKSLKVVENYPNCTLSASEMCVADLINSLRTDSRHKFKRIDEFNKKFFALQQTIATKYLKVLIKVVAPMCGMQGTASKCLDIIFKLVRVDTYKEYSTAIAEMLSLDISYLRALRLDLHIRGMFQGDSGEAALIICKIIYDNMKKSNDYLLWIVRDI